MRFAQLVEGQVVNVVIADDLETAQAVTPEGMTVACCEDDPRGVGIGDSFDGEEFWPRVQPDPEPAPE